MSPIDRPAPWGGPQHLLLAARELGLRRLALLARYRLALRSTWFRRRSILADWDSRGLGSCLRPGVPTDPAAYLAWRRSLPTPTFFFDADSDLRPGLERAAPGSMTSAVEAAEVPPRRPFLALRSTSDLAGFPSRLGSLCPAVFGAARRPLAPLERLPRGRTRRRCQAGLGALPIRLGLPAGTRLPLDR